jgi:chemotaxis methyl-accepting protein methylase
VEPIIHRGVRGFLGTAGDAIEPFAAIQRHLIERCGLDLSRYKATYLHRRLLVRVRALRLSDLSEYSGFLAAHPEEVGPLQKALSIKVTGFFRNRSCFAFLEEKVVPDLVRRSAGSPVTAWSAGCATGEEAYSLAALFASALTPGDEGRVRILATDLDEGALAAARRAVFPARALLAAAPETALRHFQVGADGSAAPKDRLKRMVRFERQSLLDRFDHRDLDLILCRNVLIYFSLEHQEDILSRFAAALAEGGYLVLGRVERLFGRARAGFEVACASERVYRRVPPSPASRALAPGSAPRGVACA